MNPYLDAGLGLAAAAVVLYCVLATRRREFPELVAIVQLVLACTGAVAGVRVGVIATTHDVLAPFSSEDRIYLVLGGLALFVASCRTIFDLLLAAAVPRSLEALATIEDSAERGAGGTISEQQGEPPEAGEHVSSRASEANG